MLSSAIRTYPSGWEGQGRDVAIPCLVLVSLKSSNYQLKGRFLIPGTGNLINIIASGVMFSITHTCTHTCINIFICLYNAILDQSYMIPYNFSSILSIINSTLSLSSCIFLPSHFSVKENTFWL